MSWQKAKLSELGWLRSAGVNKLSESNQQEVRLLNYMDIYRNQKITNAIDFQIVTAKESEIRNANLQVGDILFTPSSEKPTDIGHAGIVIEELDNTVYSYHLVRFRPDEPDKFDPNFLAYALNSFNCEKHFITRATGTTRYTLSKSDFKSLEFEYPENPAEQTAIATLLSKVDEAIAATQNSIKAAEKLKKALMQNLLTGKLKPDGSWRTEDEFYEDEKFGKVPMGWATGTLKDIAEVIAGQSPTGDTYNEEGKGIAMLNGPTEFTDYYPIPVQYTTKPTKICEVGDILFTVRGSSTGRMNFADQPYCIGRGIAAIRANENSDISFLYYTLVTIAHKILAEAKGAGSTFPNVNRGELNKKRVIFPIEKEVQKVIGAKIKEVELLEKSKQTKIQTLQRLKKSLMQNLLTGKVRLPQEFIKQFEEEVIQV